MQDEELEKSDDEILEETYEELDDDILNYSESDFLFKHAKQRIRKKLGMIMLVTGETGRGKSYFGLRFFERWYREFFKEEFPINHVCNTIDEAILLVKDFKRKGEGVLIEELSVHAGRRASMTKQNRFFNQFLDICRIKQAIIVGNSPHISFVDKHYPMMCQTWVNVSRIDFKRKITLARAYWLQTSSFKAEPYKHKYNTRDGDEINLCYMKKPDDELCKVYEGMKNKSNDNIFETIVLSVRQDRIEKLKKLGKGFIPVRLKQALILKIKGYSDENAAKEMGVNRSTFVDYICRAKRLMDKPEYEQDFENLEKDYSGTTTNAPARVST